MLYAVLTFIALQCLGDLIAAVASLPIPGMVIGMMLLLCALGIRSWWLGSQRAVPDALNRVAGTLHGHFGLLFVPAGVGVVANIDRLAADGLALLAAVLLSTAITIAATAAIAALRPKVVRPPETVPAE
jgi:holin-like protein